MNPFAEHNQRGRIWLKGNLHTHTTNSDGTKSVAERISEYSDAGYDFLSITDHHRITTVDPRAVSGQLTVIPGVELHPANQSGGPMYHMLAHCVSTDIDVEGKTPQQVIDDVRAQGGYVWLAHPYWNDVSIERDVLPLSGYTGIEVYNATCARNGRGESSVHWDQWMKYLGHAIPAIATDDSHSRPSDGDDRFQGYAYVLSKSRSVSDIMAALVSGWSYSSSGPEIHGLRATRLSNQRSGTVLVEINSSPAVRVNGICDQFGRDFPLGPAKNEFGYSRLEIRETERIRIEVVDRHGRKAWTNSIQIDELLEQSIVDDRTSVPC